RIGTVDVRTVVADCLAVLAPAAAAKGLAMRADVADDAAALHADPTAFRQILVNLLENAVRYTQDGGVTVSARAVPGATSIEVRDTGIGIAAEHLPRIFERFYRVDAGRSREQGGTGLGLAIVRHLADAHGGRVEASSILGGGTSIRVLLPRDPA
ncbi:MAG: phoR, partial [Gemmatimonadetes bacterium]|nr:phoR [Gemmatimonadota bacterium]